MDQQKARARYLIVYARLCGFLRVMAPQLVPSAELLGSNWQCTNTAFVLTTCTQVLQSFTGTAQNRHDDEVTSRN